MSRKVLSRKEKETRYIEKALELQRIWKNPIGMKDADICRQYAEGMTDEELDKGISDTVGQIQFERIIGAIKIISKTAVGIFVVLGVSGLLVFGIKQLLTLLK
jgi:hypothetical protein